MYRPLHKNWRCHKTEWIQDDGAPVNTLSPVQEVTRNGARMQDVPPCLYTGIIVIRDIWARYPILANKAKTEKAKNREGCAIREDWVRCLSVKVARHVGYDPTTNRWLTLPQCKEGRGIARNLLSRMSNDYMSQIRTVCRIPCRQCANWRVPNTRQPSLVLRSVDVQEALISQTPV